MTVTNPDLKPETIFPGGKGYPLYEPHIREPLDIMVDIDDVLFPTMMSIHDLARERGYHDGDVEPAWKGWEPYNIPEQAYWDLWSDFALADGYRKTEPIPGALEALRRLYFTGQRIHLVTARGFMNHASDIRNWTVDWVEEFGVPWQSLTFAQDKVAAMDTLEEDFGPYLEAGPFFDFAIDDSPRNIEALRNAGVRAYLLDHVHNKSHVADHRVANLDDFVDLIIQEDPRV